MGISVNKLSLETHIEMLEAARTRWPECVNPRIVPTDRDAVIFPVYPDTSSMSFRERWALPIPAPLGQVRVDLERVGPFKMGFEPKLNVLCVKVLELA